MGYIVDVTCAGIGEEIFGEAYGEDDDLLVETSFHDTQAKARARLRENKNKTYVSQSFRWP